MPYIFTNLIGSFIFDEKNRIIDQVLFKDIEENRKKAEEKLISKHKVIKPKKEILYQFLASLKDEQYIKNFRNLNLFLAKQKIKRSINEDNLICQAINSIMEADKVINLLAKRLREWYSLYNPEFSVSSNQKFSNLILRKSRDELLAEIHTENSMGADLKKQDINAILNLAKQISTLYRYQEETTHYLESIMCSYCPNLKEVAGTTIGAKLIEHTGSLKKLALLPASTIQILGAEKALFRHMKTGAKPPRHGLILHHPLVSNSPQKEHGKRARALADKISIAVKIDYFKGEFIGKKLKKELEEKFLN